MANRYPLVIDTSDQNQIKEIPNGDDLLLTGNSISGAVNITASGTVSSANVNITGDLTYRGTVLNSIASSGAYSDLTGAPTLLSQFANDVNFRSSGDNISVFTNDIGYLTTVAFGQLTSKPTTLSGYGITDAANSVQGGLATTALQPGANVSTLLNDSGFVTLSDLQNGLVTVDVNNSGDLVGSVFADDSTVMIDGLLGAVNLDGTIRGNVVPNANQHNTWDLGSNAVRFKNAYFAGAIYGDGSNLTGVAGSTGTVTFAGSTIDTNDSSGITFTPAVTMNSDLVVENDIRCSNVVYAESFQSSGTGSPTLTSNSTITLSAVDRINIARGPINQASFTTAERDATSPINGDMIYNTTTNRFQGRVNGVWDNFLPTSENEVAIGSSAGLTTQGIESIAIGKSAAAGATATATYVSGGVASTTMVVDDTTGIIEGMRITDSTGFTYTLLEQQQRVVSVDNATTLTISAVANAGTPSGTITFSAAQDFYAVAIGSSAGLTSQGPGAVAIGYLAGRVNQEAGIAIGSRAGEVQQDGGAVALGVDAGRNNQGTHGVAIGKFAGGDDQGMEAIAIGYFAGDTSQGVDSIAIGKEAGKTNQAARSIILNATDSPLNTTQTDSLIIKPIRNLAGTTHLQYDATSGEITHSDTISATIVATTATPPTANADPGDTGEIRYDDNYLYIKTASGWKRTALSGIV